ncbi:hypothetical protein MKX01_009861, partial [Papaver californicum]
MVEGTIMRKAQRMRLILTHQALPKDKTHAERHARTYLDIADVAIAQIWNIGFWSSNLWNELSWLVRRSRFGCLIIK